MLYCLCKMRHLSNIYMWWKARLNPQTSSVQFRPSLSNLQKPIMYLNSDRYCIVIYYKARCTNTLYRPIPKTFLYNSIKCNIKYSHLTKSHISYRCFIEDHHTFSITQVHSDELQLYLYAIVQCSIIESGELRDSEGHYISESNLQPQVLLKYSFTDFIIHPESLRCVWNRAVMRIC